MAERRAVQLRDALEQDIVTGRYAPGMRLDEVSLARRFNVSRTPIREALLQLASAGLVVIQPHRGAFVAEMSTADLVEMLEVMAEIEGICSRLAARRMSSENRLRLVETHEACCSAAALNDSDAYYYKNEDFHHALYAAGGNRFLAGQAQALHTRLKPYRRLQLRVSGRVRESLAEHQGIMDAVLAGEAELAGRRARAHVLVQGERFLDLIAALASAERRDERAQRSPVE